VWGRINYADSRDLMDFDGTALWACDAPNSRLLHKDVADGRLVFDCETCETRLLSPLSQFLYESIKQQHRSVSTAEMVRAVHAEEPEASIHECLQAVEDALRALTEAHMLRAVAA